MCGDYFAALTQSDMRTTTDTHRSRSASRRMMRPPPPRRWTRLLVEETHHHRCRRRRSRRQFDDARYVVLNIMTCLKERSCQAGHNTDCSPPHGLLSQYRSVGANSQKTPKRDERSGKVVMCDEAFTARRVNRGWCVCHPFPHHTSASIMHGNDMAKDTTRRMLCGCPAIIYRWAWEWVCWTGSYSYINASVMRDVLVHDDVEWALGGLL